MIITTGELISQIRNQTKSVTVDNIYVSDRLIYSLIKKHAALFLYREDSKMNLSSMSFLYTPLPHLELIDVDKVEAQCAGIRSNCIIKRTKDKLPSMFKGFASPLIGSVTSLDGSQSLQSTTAVTYVKKTNLSDFKYNKTLYYWYLNEYLYFPNIDWDAIRIEAVLEHDVDNCGNIDPCQSRQSMKFSIPDHLHSTIQAEVIKELGFTLQVKPDVVVDKQSPNR